MLPQTRNPNEPDVLGNQNRYDIQLVSKKRNKSFE